MLPLKIFAASVEFYKIKFNVIDNYGNNVSGIKFQIFNTRDEAQDAIKKIKAGTFKENAANTLVSENGVVLSGYMKINTEKYFVQINNPSSFEPNFNVYNFKLSKNDKYLTQKVSENGKTVYIKSVLQRAVELSNKFKIKLTQTDLKGFKISNVVYKIYDNYDDAEIAKNQFILNKKITHAKGLIETMKPTNKLGVAISDKYYSVGSYFIVQSSTADKIYASNPINEIRIIKAEKGNAIEKVFVDKFSYYYLKKLEPSIIAFKQRNRIL